jgi:hypothetical protein
MAVREVKVIAESGGSEVVTTQKVSSSTFFVKIDGERYSPVVTTEVEIENGDGTESVTDQCGNTERRKLSDMGWSIRVTGLITSNDQRSGNLSLQMMRDTVAQMESVTVGTDIISGEIVVTNVIITQASDLVSINTVDTEGEEQVFEFQLQLGERSTEE